MNKLLSISVVFALFLGACSNDNRNDADVILNGKVQKSSGQTLFIHELTTDNLIPVDSVKLTEEGKFSFRFKLTEAGFYILKLSKENFVTLLLAPGENVELDVPGGNFSGDIVIKGSEGSELLRQLNLKLRENYFKVDSLVDVYKSIQDGKDFVESKKQLDIAYTGIFEDQKTYVKQFIDENPRSLASIIALYQYFGNQVLLKETEDFEYFEKLSISLSEVYPDNKHVLDLRQRVSDYKRAEIQRKQAEQRLNDGGEAPEIALPDKNGNVISLSSLKGKVVLIDFWAAWCPPCRQENPHLVKLYSKYKDEGFEIYGISLDRDKDEWLKGIKEDKISWIQVSDLRYWNSPVVSLYNVQGIPYSVLIDREGKIMAKGLRYKELEQKLKEIFG